ncbi:MAG: PH domain-containing protein [Polyangiales bacterium]
MTTESKPNEPNEPTPASSDGEELLFDGRPALLPNVGALLIAILTVGLALVYFAIRRASIHYRITSQRVVIETGLLSKRLDQIDTYRINDYVVERPLGQRIMGTGNLVLSAMDRNTPDVHLRNLPTDVVALYERLRKATENEKRRRGVRLVDTEIQQ